MTKTADLLREQCVYFGNGAYLDAALANLSLDDRRLVWASLLGRLQAVTPNEVFQRLVDDSLKHVVKFKAEEHG